jgi:hypothetical protein
MTFPALSLAHYRLFMERAIGPLQRVVESLADAPEKHAAVRAEYEALAQPYYADNVVHQSYILTRAHAR